ncbi:hypothetical protein CspeluHIS016_0113380 [Cutaneotrichosporon spelunceum]|uniref:Uncharacterized protein n=1 Tax=Cutaneotrichosporon spelunceum TaxID=1672016 RepID=A0AAD3TQ46_9TREE|nr:hypothetical protein CspeluHIS016_0113380 [Cutaneotrichosporon spelunceum]
MEDPWAAWGKPSGPDKMRMPSSTPPPEPADLDPWAKPTATPRRPPRTPSPTRFSPKSPSKLSQVTLSSPPLNAGLGFPSRVPKLDEWDDVGWGTPKPAPGSEPKPTGLPDEPHRSPPLDLDAGWGEPSKPMPEPEPERELTPSPARSPRKSAEALSRVLSTDPRLSGELPRVSLEAEAFSRPGSGPPPPLPDSRPGSASPEPSLRPSADISPPSSPAGPVTVAFDTTDLGAGFAAPFGPSSPTEPKLNVPPEVKRSSSFGSDFGGFADLEGEDAGGWGETSWTDEGGWKEETYGGWGDVPRAESPPKQNQQELDWEKAQRRLAAADARAPHEHVMRLRRGWEEVAEMVIGDNKLETSEEKEQTLDDNARTLQESVSETLRGLTEVPDTTFAFGHSATRERSAQALSRAPRNAMTLLRAPLPRRRDSRNLYFGPGLEGWAARSRLGEPEAAVQAAQAEPEQAKGWGFWRRQATPKPLLTSGGGVLEVKTDLDTTSIASAPGSARSMHSKAPSISSRPGTPSEARPSTSARPSISSIPGAGSISGPSLLSGPPSAVTPTDVPEKKPEASRMSRLFRWSKKEEKKEEEEAKDEELELGESDFAFLDQVPSMAGADLLGGGMASIDELLSMKKEVPLPAPLAPPPRSGSSSARLSTGAQRKSDAFDLFASLDFDDASPAPSAATMQPSSSGFGWDDLLASSGSSATMVPKLSSPPRTSTSTLQPLRASTPPVMGTGLQPRRTTTPPIMAQGLQPTRSATPPLRPSPLSSLTPERPRYGPSGPALGAHARQRPSASGMDSVSRQARQAPQAVPPPPKDFGFGDLSFVLDAPPSGPSAPANPDLFGMATLCPSPPPAPSGMGIAPLAPSPMGMGMSVAALAPSPPPTSMRMSMAPLRPGIAALTPSPSPQVTQPSTSSFSLAIPPSASQSLTAPTATPVLGPPTSLSGPISQPAAVVDDFGDFGDFGSFDTPTATDDDFGDFGDFGDSTSGFNTGVSAGFNGDSASGFGSANVPAYSSFGTPRPQPTNSTGPRVFSRPVGLPTGLTKSRQSSFADSASRVRPPRASPTPGSQRTSSVDHRATFTLMAAAQAKDAVIEAAPLSPVPEPLSPPPVSGPQSFSALIPPPPGGVRRPAGNRGLIDLLDD